MLYFYEKQGKTYGVIRLDDHVIGYMMRNTILTKRDVTHDVTHDVTDHVTHS